MPIYEYRCNSCQHIFEILTTSGAASSEKTVCSKCGSDRVDKIISAGSFRRATDSVSSGSCASPPSLACGKKSGFS